MFTVCPKCTLTLAVAAADLRIGQGYVRCGRCTNVFNALLTLSEAPADADASLPHEPPPVVPAAVETAAAAVMQAVQGAADSDYPAAGDIESDSSTDEGTGTFETIVLEGDGILQTEEFVSEATFDDEFAALSERLGAAEQARATADHARGAYESEEVSFNLDAEPASAALPLMESLAPDTAQMPATNEFAPIDLGRILPESAARSWRWYWLVGIILLALLLAVQWLDHRRNELAARPRWNAPLTRVYALLGVTLAPYWDLGAYDVRQQGAESDPAHGNAIRVRLSVANRAARAQPPPVLRLTLRDRYGKRIAARDLSPADYLPKEQSGLKFLSPDQRIDSLIAVQDPGPDASSFELDVCLDAGGGSLRCAGDAAAVAAR